MSATEHKAQSLDALGEVHLNYDEGLNGTARATIALTHATLYLAEQQRIANLIALGLGTSSRDVREGLGLS